MRTEEKEIVPVGVGGRAGRADGEQVDGALKRSLVRCGSLWLGSEFGDDSTEIGCSRRPRGLSRP